MSAVWRPDVFFILFNLLDPHNTEKEAESGLATQTLRGNRINLQLINLIGV